MRDYRKIEAWQLADDLAVEIYRVSSKFPSDEKFGLTSQIRRAAISVPANIAEGSAKDSQRDYLRFLYIARGSLTEVQYYIHLAARLKHITDDTNALNTLVENTFKRLHGLINAVEKQI